MKHKKIRKMKGESVIQLYRKGVFHIEGKYWCKPKLIIRDNTPYPELAHQALMRVVD